MDRRRGAGRGGRTWRLPLLACLILAGVLLSSAPAFASESSSSRDPRMPSRFSMAFTGDILVHGSVWSQAAAYGNASGERFDFRPMFAPVRNLLTAADVAVCHLETPVSATDTHLSSYPVFNVPHEIVDAIAWAGYDGCSTASNHSLDQGLGGIRATVDALEDAGLQHTGTAATPAQSRRIAFYRVGRAKIAHLSYTFSFNGRSRQFGWEANLIDPAQILAEARRARQAGSDFTVVSLHWGAEYQHQATSYQRWLGRRLTGSRSVDLVVGHHAHVVQPIARSGGEPVVYGMGNFLSGQTRSYLGTPSVEDGVIVWAVVRRVRGSYRVTEVQVTPTWVAPGTYRILPAQTTASAPSTTASLAAALRASFSRTMAQILAMGGARFGVSATRMPPFGAPF